MAAKLVPTRNHVRQDSLRGHDTACMASIDIQYH